MKNKVVLLLFIVCCAWTATAQTVADSLALVAAHWQVTSLKKGVLCRKAFFNSLYGVPQEVSILEITPKYYNLDVLIHQPKEETSVAAHRSGAIAAVNGSYFRFLSVRLNRLKNKLLANYLRNRGNDLATVRNSAFCVAILSNNSFICKYNIFFRKYELSVAIL